MRLEKKSPCKVNLLLNILGRRADGFHELETVLHPVNVCDQLTFARGGNVLRTLLFRRESADGFAESGAPRRHHVFDRRQKSTKA